MDRQLDNGRSLWWLVPCIWLASASRPLQEIVPDGTRGLLIGWASPGPAACKAHSSAEYWKIQETEYRNQEIAVKHENHTKPKTSWHSGCRTAANLSILFLYLLVLCKVMRGQSLKAQGREYPRMGGGGNIHTVTPKNNLEILVYLNIFLICEGKHEAAVLFPVPPPPAYLYDETWVKTLAHETVKLEILIITPK